MRSSQVGRWVLLAALVLGVLLMHHVPISHGHGAAPAGSGAGTALAAGPAGSPAHDHHGHGTTAAHQADPAVLGAAEIGAVPAQQHSPLHLCLAILVGFAALLLPLLGKRPHPATGRTSPLRTPARTSCRAPPLPVPRRLAVLCVLRR